MKQNLESFPQQCKYALGLNPNIKIKGVNKIIVAGVGGSAFAGSVLKTLLTDEISVVVAKDYGLPKDVDSKTLIFAVSYSGNTEETLYSVNEAIRRQCKIVGISSGGDLEKICKEKKLYHIKIPAGIEPRNALGYLLIPMLLVLQKNYLIEEQPIEEMIRELQKKQKVIKKQGVKIANVLFNRIPLIYSSEKLSCLSYGFKTRLNENSKIHAFSHQIPELDHNELVGYTKKIGDFYTIIIKDKDDFLRNKKRYDVTKKLIEKFGGECIIIETFGSSLISRIFNMLHLADWISYHLALKYQIDPGPVNIIEDLKKELKKK